MQLSDILGEIDAKRPSRDASSPAALLVAGRVAFTGDMVLPERTLHCVPVLAAITVGRIANIDLARVRGAPGVAAVLTAADIPGTNDFADNPVGEDLIIAGDRIAFNGQVQFAVVAETADAARHAAELARVSISPGMPAIDVDDALTADATLEPDYVFQRGSASEQLGRSPKRIDGQFRIGAQAPMSLERQVALAAPDGEGGILIHCATEHPARVRRVVARVLGRPESGVEIRVRRIGGAFGGKRRKSVQWAALAALATSVTGRPCFIALDRSADTALTGTSHDVRADYAAGISEDGAIRAVDLTLAARGGYSRDGTAVAVDGAMFHADNAYSYPVARIVGRRLRTNTATGTDFRGSGAQPGILFAERLMDHIACALKLDPLAVRKANLYGSEGKDLTPYGLSVADLPLARIVEALEASSEYARRRAEIAASNARSPILKRGLALTPVKYGVGEPDLPQGQASALVQLDRDGTLTVCSSAVESGQGLSGHLARHAARRFGVGMERVRVTAGSTAMFGGVGPGGAAVEVDLNVSALDNACDVLIDRLVDFIAARWQVAQDGIAFREGRISLTNRSLNLTELAEAAFAARVALEGLGHAKTPAMSWMRDFVTGRPFHYFVCGAACSEVTIDTMTGEARLDRVDILLDAGRPANAVADRVIIEGGFVQGLGWLTTEEPLWDSAGRMTTRGFGTYKIPAVSALPADVRIAYFEGGGEVEGLVGQAKAIGDAPLMLASSVFSAITDAVASLRPGVMPRLDAPATPEAIIKAVRAMAGPGR